MDSLQKLDIKLLEGTSLFGHASFIETVSRLLVYLWGFLS